MGCIVFTALAQGLLTDRYLDGVPKDSRAARSGSTIGDDHLDEATLRHVRNLNEIAAARGQKLAQLALQWALRDSRVTSAVIGASSVAQLDTNLDALQGPPLTDEELAAIDQHAVDAGINLWAESAEGREEARRNGQASSLCPTRQAAAPTMPAVLRRVAEMISVSMSISGMNSAPCLLTPPPTTKRSGEKSFSRVR